VRTPTVALLITRGRGVRWPGWPAIHRARPAAPNALGVNNGLAGGTVYIVRSNRAAQHWVIVFTSNGQQSYYADPWDGTCRMVGDGWCNYGNAAIIYRFARLGRSPKSPRPVPILGRGFCLGRGKRGQRRDQDERAPAGEFFGDPQGGEAFYPFRRP